MFEQCQESNPDHLNSRGDLNGKCDVTTRAWLGDPILVLVHDAVLVFSPSMYKQNYHMHEIDIVLWISIAK